MNDQWKRLVERVAMFEQRALEMSFTGDWEDEPKPVHFIIKPPAEEDDIARVEQRIGQSLPSSLRKFFKECSSGINIVWFLPAKIVVENHLYTVAFSIVPPKPFSDENNDPLINKGSVRVDLEDIAQLWEERESWITSFRKAATEKQDKREQAHYAIHANMAERSFPIARDGGGNVVAMDMESPDQELFMSFHDGSDEPASLFGQNLLDHLEEQSRLGFIGFGNYGFFMFENDQKSSAARARFNARYKDRETIEKYGLAPIGACVIDWTTDNGKAWREWLGLTA
ncbi:SMI1/KNR4 family protein [Agrobacterium sp. lyk4-40-TYG-31]|uniref:SMI1/KNR4 family protein n=1 Tax=Agrobacterium sp. lyk4-40-TYG-31 TaxID=3040276 RepID=UPI00254D6174|nr:SMI1/KNR4 family protein [Agrobacterium sp. lyk4-40-TYG-31]